MRGLQEMRVYVAIPGVGEWMVRGGKAIFLSVYVPIEEMDGAEMAAAMRVAARTIEATASEMKIEEEFLERMKGG